MPPAYPSLADHLRADGPKRILALDGGGLRSSLSLGFLAAIETLLRDRHGGDPDFRLCHYFDLIAGTSTGAIIAALLAKGWAVAEVIRVSLELADKVMAPRWWQARLGQHQPRYQPRRLERFLQQHLGTTCRIGDQQQLKTGLLVMSKRLDTGSPWPISNNPAAVSSGGKPNGFQTSGQQDHLLWKVVQASCAAPRLYQPLLISLAAPDHRGQAAEIGTFIDGGVSPHNNPALQAYGLACLEAFGLHWPVGREHLLIISVGSGRMPRPLHPSKIALLQAVTALESLIADCNAMVDSLLQGMGDCLYPPRSVNQQPGALAPQQRSGEARYSYARYDVKLYQEDPSPRPHDGQNDNPYLEQIDLGAISPKSMQAIDKSKPCRALLQLGLAAASGKVQQRHFPAAFDLRGAATESCSLPARHAISAASPTSGCQTYRQREAKPVTAMRLNLEMQSFTYQKWGGTQTCNQGDWLVERDGQMHTVAADTFARTYRQVGPATYSKQTLVWAKPAESDGVIATQEGTTAYRKGDYLVWNDQEGRDGYAIGKETFESLYQPTTAA